MNSPRVNIVRKPYRKVSYLTCQACGKNLRIRKDGKFPKHRETRRALAFRGYAYCIASESAP